MTATEGSARRLREGDELPRFEFDTGDGGRWPTAAHRVVGSHGVPLVLILHRHLA